MFVLEVALIDMQAWRGTASHFNAATLFDRVVFIVMGSAILIQTLISVAVAVALGGSGSPTVRSAGRFGSA